jgi:signal transduction histidine kinase
MQAGAAENTRHPQPWEAEHQYLGADGQPRWAIARGAPMFDEAGRFVGSVGTLLDITERRRAEEENARLLEKERRARAAAQQADHAKDEFIAVLSHELRAPLAAVRGAAELLRRLLTPADPRVDRALDILLRNTQLQSRLVDDLLDLSRIERGKLELRCAPAELAPMVQAAVAAWQDVAEQAGLTLETRCEPDVWIEADRDRFQQIVSNLLSNAVKYTPAPGRVTVSAERDGGRAVVRVVDTGKGIEPSEMPYLFEIFRQGENGSLRQPGLGVGLALVKSLTELHRGTVRVESAGRDRGSAFVLRLPLVARPADDEAPGGGPAAT